MDPPEPTPAAPRPPSATRIALAFGIVAVFLVAGLGYHDGAFAVDDLESAQEPGVYRFKGVIERFSEEDESLRMRDDSGVRDLHWNLTTPSTDSWYVVSAELHENGTLEALALSRVYVLRS